MIVKYKWINNGVISKKHDTSLELPVGWVFGRINVHSDETKKILSEYGKRNNPEKRKETIRERYGHFTKDTNSNKNNKVSEYHLKQQKIQESLPFEEKRWRFKRNQILLEQNNVCLICKLNEWQNQYLPLHLDHIDGNNKNNARNNLRFLCPNCHAQTPTWGNKKRKSF